MKWHEESLILHYTAHSNKLVKLLKITKSLTLTELYNNGDILYAAVIFCRKVTYEKLQESDV